MKNFTKNTLIIAASIVIGSIVISQSIDKASLNHRYILVADGTEHVDQRNGTGHSTVKHSISFP
jgi:hypothetical protein